MSVAIIGIVILVVSAAGAILWIRRDAPDQQRQMKVLLFVLYFWVLAFIQLIVAAIGYSLLTR
jgi:L-cystine uptake protein TcyP (sodium:dicarboxylate symporter family)